MLMEVLPDHNKRPSNDYVSFEELERVFEPTDFLQLYRTEIGAGEHLSGIGSAALCSTCDERTDATATAAAAATASAMPLELESTRSFLRALQAAYAPLHGPASIAICSISILVNAAIVVVLTRRHMLTTSNTLLTAIACVDILKMLLYTVFAARFSLPGEPLAAVSDFSVGWIVFLVLQSNAVLVLHGVQTWTNVLLAWLRLVMVSSVRGRQLVSVRTARLAVLMLLFANLFVYTPNYLVRIEQRLNGSCVDPEPELPVESPPQVDRLHYALTPLLENATVIVTITATDTTRDLLTLSNETHAQSTGLLNQMRNESDRAAPGGDGDVGESASWPRYWWFCPLDPAFSTLASLIHGPILKLLASVLISVPTALLIVKLQQAAARRRRLKAGQASAAHSERKPSLIHQLHSRLMSSITRRMSTQTSPPASNGTAQSAAVAVKDRSTKSLLIYLHRQSWVSECDESGPSMDASLKLKRPSIKARQMESNSSTTWMLVAVR